MEGSSEGFQSTRPVVKNLSAPLQKAIQPSGLIQGGSSSPSQLIRTLVNFPLTESSSTGPSCREALPLLLSLVVARDIPP